MMFNARYSQRCNITITSKDFPAVEAVSLKVGTSERYIFFSVLCNVTEHWRSMALQLVCCLIGVFIVLYM